MQTFLPYKDIEQSARSLDKIRCWKQCIEAYQLINTLEGKSNGWKNHPACKMWKDYLPALKYYYNVFLKHCIEKRNIKVKKLSYMDIKEPVVIPKWLDDDLINSHRSNLLRKNKEFYCIYGWNVPDNLSYKWPN